jgi:hypothetical protein
MFTKKDQAMTTATVDRERLASITYLEDGAHHEPTADGPVKACLLEAVAYVAGEDWTTHPRCASRVLAALGRPLNDLLPNQTRQRLLPMVPRLVGTADDGLDRERGYLAVDWLIRVCTPTWLDLAGLSESAAELRAVGRIVDETSAKRAKPIVHAGHKAAITWDARTPFGAATWAVRAAARTFAWDATGTAEAAARAAAGTVEPPHLGRHPGCRNRRRSRPECRNCRRGDGRAATALRDRPARPHDHRHPLTNPLRGKTRHE